MDNTATAQPMFDSKVPWQVEQQPNGKFAIRGLKIFRTHQRKDDQGRLFNCDSRWMRKAETVFAEDKAKGHLPPVVLGHNPENPDAAPEKPAEFFIDNVRFDGSEYLYGDYVDISPQWLAELKQNRWPSRSPEVWNPDTYRINCVALLGGSPPYFKDLGDLRFKESRLSPYIYQETFMAAEEPGKAAANPDAAIDTPEVREKEEKEKFYQMWRECHTRYTEESKKEEEEKAKQEMEKKELSEGKDKDGDGKPGDPNKLEAPKPDEDKTDYREKYEAQLKYNEELSNKLKTLEDANERAAWVAKYTEKKIPAGLLKIDDEVKFLMDLPSDKRQNYFDRSISHLPQPSTKLLEDAALPGGNPARPAMGSPAEHVAVMRYYESKREQYRGDVSKARRDFRQLKDDEALKFTQDAE